MGRSVIDIQSDHVWIEGEYVSAVIEIDADSGRILAVKKNSNLADCYNKKMAMKQIYILPGLVDCHTHAGMAGPGGDANDDVNDSAHFVTPFFKAVDAVDTFNPCFARAAQSGITTICVLPGPGCAVGGQAGAVLTKANDPFKYILRENIGIKVALGTSPRQSADLINASPMTKMALYAMIRESFQKAKVMCKNDQQNRDLSCEGWRPILEGNAPMRVHCHREDDIVKMLRFSEDEGIRIVLEHGTEALNVVDELVKRNIPVVCTDTLLKVPKYLEEKGAEPDLPANMMKKGIRVALSTNFPETAWDALLILASHCVKCGVPYAIVIDSITRVPAEIMGLEKDLGTIEAGKWADFSFWSGDPMKFTTVPMGVMIHGEIHEEKGLL